MTNRTPIARKIHFHSSDNRFCGTAEIARQFTMNPNEVTCQDCQKSDTFVLTEQGQRLVDHSFDVVAAIEGRSVS